MTIMKPMASALAAAAFLLGSHSVQAQLSQLTMASQLAATDAYTSAYPGAAGSILTGPFSVYGGGNTVTFNAPTSVTRVDADGMSSDFAAGTSLIETFDGFSPNGPLHFDFAQGVTEFGVYAQDFAADMETFTVTAYDGGTTLGMFSVGPLDNTSNSGMAAFLGAQATGGAVITGVTISSQSDQPGANNDFLVGPVALSVPEPTQYLSLGMGILGLGAFARRARKRT